MGRLLFVIDQNVIKIIFESPLNFFKMARGGFKCGHPRALHCVNPGSGHPDVDEFVSSLDLEENSVTSLVHQSILCSEYASLEESIKTNG